MGMFTIKPTNSAVGPTGPTQRAIFYAGGTSAPYTNISNLISDSGVVANDTTGVGTQRQHLAGAKYGVDKAIMGYGHTAATGSPTVGITNLVSNQGVVASDTSGVGTARGYIAAAGFGGDKAIFGYGTTGNLDAFRPTAITNKVSNSGVVASDTNGVGTVRHGLAAAGYGGSDGITDKAIFGYGAPPNFSSMTNLVSNTGVVATDVTGVGTGRWTLAAASYGGDKAIFGYGYVSGNVSLSNLVNNNGVVAADVTGVGTTRHGLAAAGFAT